MTTLSRFVEEKLLDRGRVPDSVVRFAIRALLRRRLATDVPEHPKDVDAAKASLLAVMSTSPVAVVPDVANRQHYEVPPAFFESVLGPRLKYSCCLWNDDVETLEAAEEAMLSTTADRADLSDGQSILELGCGWGSLTLWMAEAYPSAAITAVSNSAPQRRFIEARAEERGLRNVEVITADMNEFGTKARFDRVVSVEMFEHMRNWATLLGRVRSWLDDDGLLFLHVFCHRSVPYFFEDEGADDWMSRHFFTGGLMPSFDLAGSVRDDLLIDSEWQVSGSHYAKTSRAWLNRLDADRDGISKIFDGVYGADADSWIVRWRVFFMACEELFAFRGGREWFVAHTRLKKSP